MGESINNKVLRYRKEFPQRNGEWYYNSTRNHIYDSCDSCKHTIELDTIYIYTTGLYRCEHCVLGTDRHSSPHRRIYPPKQVEQTKQPTPTSPPPKPTWIINSNGICYHCNVNDCIHTRRKR